MVAPGATFLVNNATRGSRRFVGAGRVLVIGGAGAVWAAAVPGGGRVALQVGAVGIEEATDFSAAVALWIRSAACKGEAGCTAGISICGRARGCVTGPVVVAEGGGADGAVEVLPIVWSVVVACGSSTFNQGPIILVTSTCPLTPATWKGVSPRPFRKLGEAL